VSPVGSAKASSLINFPLRLSLWVKALQSQELRTCESKEKVSPKRRSATSSVATTHLAQSAGYTVSLRMNSSLEKENQTASQPTEQQLTRCQRKRLRRKQLSKAFAQKLTLENAVDSTKTQQIARKVRKRLQQHQREFKKGLQLSKSASVTAVEEKPSFDWTYGSKSLEIRDQSNQRLIARQQLVKAEEKKTQYLKLKHIYDSLQNS